MTFLQPLMLLALPLIALPIVIHLVNQNRHRSIPWAATRFLIQAQKMVTGMRRLRYWLILAARTLAMAGLVLAVSRPMSGGWLGLTVGGAADTTVIVLDRSVSMEQQDSASGMSRREAALQKLTDLLQTTSTGTQLVLIDSATGTPLKLESAADLSDLPETQSSATTADMPALLQTAAEYLASNQAGRADVWVCSDLQQGDWNPQGGRWEAVRQLFGKREGTRLYLLTFPLVDQRNLSVRVDHVHRRETSDGAELALDITITRTGTRTGATSAPAAPAAPEMVPLTFVINGARSTLNVEVTGGQVVRNGHVIPIDVQSQQGWGRVELPADSNPADNVYGFVYADAALQQTVIVSDDEQTAAYCRIAAATPASQSLVYDAVVLASSQVAAVPWDTAGLIVWQAELPSGAVAEQLQAFVASGRCVLFLPPAGTAGNTAEPDAVFGTSWGEWVDVESSDELSVSRWRAETDLLANSQSGTPLPAGSLKVFRYRRIESRSMAQLAELSDGGLLLGRALDASGTDQGAVWFCSTLPPDRYSTLVRNGVVFYVMIHRALAQGAASLGAARQLDCRWALANSSDAWEPLEEVSQRRLLSHRAVLPGLYRDPNDVLLAVNRPLTEDAVERLDDSQLQQVLGDVSYTRIENAADSQSSLASEIWRAFLCLMIAALLAEAVLCVPDRARSGHAAIAKT